MSVPLPSPSPLASASVEPAPSRSRPRPINTSDDPSSVLDGSPRDRRPASGMLGRSPSSPSGSPRSSSVRRQGPTRSIGFSTSVSGTDENWRERTGTTPSKSAVRTVGGFDKSNKGNNNGGANGVSVSPVKDKESALNGEKGEKGLSHVPCRFFKAGACTAGSNCPFSHEDGAKKEICQWFLKGNCKFGHKCALAHVRPGEPMSMDRKNKKAAQLEAREREGKGHGDLRSPVKSSPAAVGHAGSTEQASPVPIKSALSSSIQSPPAHRLPSSPLRDPFGPPPPAGAGSASPGFARSPAAASAFASSPSRPSPLSASVSARPSGSGPLSLKGSMHSPLRPPSTAFSSSFSHSAMKDRRTGNSPLPPLSASFADGTRKNIWARSETPNDRPEVLSPRRMIDHRPRRSQDDVFADDQDDDDEDGDDLAFAVPDSLAELLTPRERARRMSRRDSQDSFSASPSRGAFIQKPLWSGSGAERLAQSAGPTMGPGYLQGLWSAEGGDARKVASPHKDSTGSGDFTFGPNTAVPPASRQQSLLTQQRSPKSSQEGFSPTGQYPSQRSDLDANAAPFLIRTLGDPSSPSARALQEHAPGQSLPGGLANALSRIHLQGNNTNVKTSGLALASLHGDIDDLDQLDAQPVMSRKKEDHVDEGVFAMEG
ncbi:hypothetical protein BD324DRAFT_654292 [Kockovaella imperatae]|uniref:C3H1-type domain-containing protein n=1 Tax=Kockovaella imperatae TaxID=4999 RepID=A0A1Y1U6Y1_9TREE|nr:hypothetical protein BD324DRAFT_654292 [Kockovaella imperatae]ORX33257.1 hypothetical protein BD324DRAFT_654292 [Kockovaella imperatae]